MPTNQCLVLKHSNLVKGTSFFAQIWLLIHMRQNFVMGSSSRDLLSLYNNPKSHGVTRVFSNNICNDLRKALATSTLTPKRTSQVAIEVPSNHLQTQCPHSKHPM